MAGRGHVHLWLASQQAPTARPNSQSHSNIRLQGLRDPPTEHFKWPGSIWSQEKPVWDLTFSSFIDGFSVAVFAHVTGPARVFRRVSCARMMLKSGVPDNWGALMCSAGDVIKGTENRQILVRFWSSSHFFFWLPQKSYPETLTWHSNFCQDIKIQDPYTFKFIRFFLDHLMESFYSFRFSPM